MLSASGFTNYCLAEKFASSTGLLHAHSGVISLEFVLNCEAYQNEQED